MLSACRVLIVVETEMEEVQLVLILLIQCWPTASYSGIRSFMHSFIYSFIHSINQAQMHCKAGGGHPSHVNVVVLADGLMTHMASPAEPEPEPRAPGNFESRAATLMNERRHCK
jgi:hypothetical protein